MPARLNPKHDARTRDKIKTSQLLNRLTSFALGGVDGKTKKPIEMTSAQVTAALGVLRKTLPDLQAIELDAQVETKHHIISDETMSEDAWNQTYGDSVATTAGTSKSIN